MVELKPYLLELSTIKILKTPDRVHAIFNLLCTDRDPYQHFSQRQNKTLKKQQGNTDKEKGKKPTYHGSNS